MNIFHNIYQKTLFENENNIQIWEEHLQTLKDVNFDLYAEKLKVPVLVPIGSRILFRGELKHTNEVIVALGADYFAKCSIKQAEELRQHRIKVAQETLESFMKEREYLRNKIIFNKQNVFDAGGQEIVEVYNEEEDIIWRKKHRENVKKYIQRQAKEEKETEEITDEELWDRLEELELQEELEEELENMNRVATEEHVESLIFKKDNINTHKGENTGAVDKKLKIVQSKEIKEVLNQNSKFDIFQQVLQRQDDLEIKLLEMKHRARAQSKTENELIERLNEIEKLDELEDEIDRIDDIIQDTEENDPEEKILKQINVKKSVSFADEDDSETLELTFSHSEEEPNNTPYSPEKGILKPSDLYEAYSNLFTSEATSILKRKLKASRVKKTESKSAVKFEAKPVVNKTIVVKDIIEKAQQNVNKVQNGARPTSLFKKKRMQSKT